MEAAGPGKYDAECTSVMESTSAALVIVIVAGGNRGAGFSMQVKADHGEHAGLFIQSAVMLRGVAEQIERDAMRMGTGARARARMVIEAGRSSLTMLSYGLGAVSASFATRPELLQSVMAAVNHMTKASDELDRALGLLRIPQSSPPRGAA